MVAWPKRKVIYRQGDAASELFLIKKGAVRLVKLRPDGKRLELATLGPGTFFGEIPLLGGLKRNATAEAAEDCLLCVIGATDLEHLILRRPEMGFRMLRILGRRLLECEERMEEMAFQSAAARLAMLLLRLTSSTGGALEAISHQEVAEMIGVYRETVTKILDMWRRLGYVQLGRRRIRVLARKALQELAYS